MTTEERVSLAVARLIDDIHGRKGLGDEWDQIDDDVQAEIREDWEEIIHSALSAP